MALLDYALLTVQEARLFPGMPRIEENEHEILEALINEVTDSFEEFCGKALIQRTFIENHYWADIERRIRADRTSKLWLKNYPIISVTSVVDQAGNTIAATDYWIDKDHGWLIMPVLQNSSGFSTYWTVTYVGGHFVSRPTVITSVKLAAKMQIAHILRNPDDRVVEKQVGDLRLRYKETENSDRAMDLIPQVQEKLGTYITREL